MPAKRTSRARPSSPASEPAVVDHDGDASSDPTLRRQPRQSRGQRRVDLLLEAAAALIAEHGIEAATAEAIAQRAHTAKGSLYQFFPNRDAVLTALALRYAGELQRIHERAFPADPTALSLERLIDHIVRPLAAFHDRNPAFSRVFATADGPGGTHNAPGRIRSHLFSSVVERLDLMFAARNPRLGMRERHRIALVCSAIGQALLARRDAALAADKKPLLDDLRRVLAAYLQPVLEPVEATPRTARVKRARTTSRPRK